MPMGIGAVGSGQPTSNASASSGTAAGGQLGENTFLQLLVAQLKYQDPMQPVDNTQFVTQLAQFQSLSMLTSIKTDLDELVAATGAAKTQSSAPGPGSGAAAAAPAPGSGG